MAIETVSIESGEIVSLDEAKRELGYYDDDSRVQLLLESARDYCERWSERTLRLSATRTYATREWPSGGWVLRYPPVTAVSSITYYDTDNSLQTFATANYQANLTAGGYAVIEYTDGTTLPTLYDRQDAVIVTYTTGYSSAAVAPAAAKRAIILAMQSLDEIDNPRVAELTAKRTIDLLSTVSAHQYA